MSTCPPSRRRPSTRYGRRTTSSISTHTRYRRPWASSIACCSRGGFALITLPDLQAVCRYIAEDKLEDVLYQSPAGPIHPIDVVYGHRPSIGRGNRFMAHRTGFTASTLGAKLARAGFRPVRVKRRDFNLWAVGYKPAGNAG